MRTCITCACIASALPVRASCSCRWSSSTYKMHETHLLQNSYPTRGQQ